jgi:aryl-alcohol dehydrogenase-like predicted oxidoreductase
VVIATKGGLRKEGDQLVRDASPTWLREGLEASPRALGTDYVDLYQLHWPDPKTPFEDTAQAMDEFVKEGKVRYVGVSNFDASQMARFEATRKIDALQPPYHLFRRDIEASILPYTLHHDVDVAIVGARNPSQIEQTAPAAEIQLGTADLAEIERIMRSAVPVGGPAPELM